MKVTCDCCGKVEEKEMGFGYICPPSWFYAEISVNDEPKSPLIIFACSEQCKKVNWSQGPGDLYENCNARGVCN